MFTMFLESPMPILLIGAVAIAVLGVMLIVTRRGVLLYAIAGALAVVAIGVVVERLVVTERERVEMAIDGAAAALEDNDAPAVQTFVAAKTDSDILRRLDYYLKLVEFEKITIRNLEIEVNHWTNPPTAEARFDGTARFTEKTGTFGGGVYPGTFRARLIREKDGWKFYDVEGDPNHPFRSSDDRVR
jgi:hypothetical protein